MDAPMNDNMLACFTTILTSETELNFVDSVENFLHEYRPFSIQKSSHLQEVIGHMHTCLNLHKLRMKGLLLLSAFINQCNTEIFTQNVITWLRSILQILQSHDPPTVLKMTCHVCRDLLRTVSVFTSLGREVTAIIPQLLTTVIAASQQWKSESFLVINSCICYYSGACGAFKGKIETTVHEELIKDNPSEETIRCWALLARCGTGGNQGIKYTEGWSTQYSKVFCTLEHVAYLLYQDINDDFLSKQRQPSMPLGQIPPALSDKLPVLAARFENLTMCLCKLISESFPSVVRIPVEDILQFSCKVLAVTPKWLQSFPSTDRLMLAGYLPTIHGSVISLLSILIQRLKTLLLPHSKQIMSMLVTELIWSHSSSDYGQFKLYSSLRQRVYTGLGRWFQHCKCMIETVNEEDNLLSELLHDCRPQIDTVKISSRVYNVKEGSDHPPAKKKKKKGGYQELSMGISTQRKVDPKANHQLTLLSLEALYQWIMAAGTQMKEKTYMTFMEFIINTSLKVSQNKQEPGIPYSDSHCRLKLFHCLKALAMVPHHKVISPVQCAISIFCTASSDTCTQVSTFCRETLRYLDVIIHPRAPYFTKAKIVNEHSDRDHCQTSGTPNVFIQQNVPMSSLFASQNWQQPQSSKEDHTMQVDSPIPSSSKENMVSNWDSRSEEGSESSSDISEVCNTVGSENTMDRAVSSTDRAVVKNPTISNTSKATDSDNAGDIALSYTSKVMDNTGDIGKSNTGKVIVQDSIDQDIIVRRGSIVLGVGEQLVDCEEVRTEKSLDASGVSHLTTKGTGEKTPVQHEDCCTTQSDTVSSAAEGLGRDSDSADVQEERTDSSAPYSCSVNITKEQSMKSSDVNTPGTGQDCTEKTEVDSMLSAFMDIDAEGAGD